MIEYSLSNDCLDYVEIFFVLKNDGRLRLIVDARRSNCHFADPNLCTGDALGRIELEPGETLHISMADLKDAFITSPSPFHGENISGFDPYVRAF